MRSKDLSTVRISGLAPETQKGEIREFFARSRLSVMGDISLCPCRTIGNAHLVGTITFSSPAEAKKALDLNCQILGRSSILTEREFTGFTVLAAPKEPSVDIIAVHGLNGHAYGTWAYPTEAKGAVEAMWLRDFLPIQVPSARVIIYGYNSILLGAHTSVSSVKDFSMDLLQRIVDDRVTAADTERPIMFICHSLGGLVIKQALVTAHKDNRRFGQVFAASKFLMFFGTPHKGSRAAGIALPFSNIAALAFQRPPKQLLQTLKTDSPILSGLLAEFNSIRASFTIVSLYERRTTPILNALVVDEDSSCLGDNDEIRIPTDATHSQMCKFRGASDALFLPIVEQIKRYSGTTEKGVLQKNVTGNRHSQIPTDENLGIERRGLFMVPASPNPYFEGRKAELDRLEILLNTRKQVGLSSHCPIVAVHGLGGIGKTQLATQYVYNRKARRPHTCTFWVSARSEEELRSGLESILDKLDLDPTLLMPSKTIEPGISLLRAWMTSTESGDWLLVLDNYDEIEVRLDDFVPTEAVGSVLITSRDRKIIGSVANSGLSLTAMNELDAKHLFLRLSSPTAESVLDALQPVEEIQALDDTLQELQYFPLAIDQAASFIRENSPMTVKEYLDYLKPRSLDRERLLRFKQARPEYPESVMTTWEISLAYLNKINPRACWILQLLGFMDNNSISEDLLLKSVKDHPWGLCLDFDLGTRHLPENLRAELAYLKNDIGFREAVGTLTSLSLIQRNAESRDLSVHPLVHEWIRVRLNMDPETQANWTIIVALILFQTFPFERCIDLLSSRTFDNVDYHFSLVEKHVENLLENLRDYIGYLKELPIECFILCETLFLVSSSGYKHTFLIRVGAFRRLRHKLDETIQSILSRLSPEYTSIASFVHRLIVWATKPGPNRGSNKTKQKMADVLANLRIKRPIENSNVLFLMLLTKAVVQVSACMEDANSREITSHAPHADAAAQEYEKNALQQQRSNSRLLLMLQDLLQSAKNGPAAPLIYELTHSMVKRRLISCISAQDFVRYDFLHPAKLLASDHLKYLSFSKTGEHICQLAQLLWNHKGPKDYDGTKLLFSVAYRQWKFFLAKEHSQAIKEAADHSTMCQTSSGYISSSFGRSLASETLYAKDLETPLQYVWEITELVAIRIADGNARWTTRQHLQRGPESSAFALDLAERRSAEDLFIRMEQLYSKIVALGFSCKATKTKLQIDAFGPDDCDFTLTRIYVATEQWHKAQRLVMRWLQCRSITEFCNSCDQKGSFPWLERTNSSPPRSPIVPPTPCGTPTPIGTFEGNLRQKIDDDHLQGYRQIGSLKVPESCNCIFKLKIGEMIEAFLAIAGAQGRLSPEAKLELDQRLQLLQINLIPDESCLGRLELIYKVAENYPEELNPPTCTVKVEKARNVVGQHIDEWAGQVLETSSTSSEGGSEDNEDRNLDSHAAASEEEELNFEW